MIAQLQKEADELGKPVYSTDGTSLTYEYFLAAMLIVNKFVAKL